MLFANMGGFVLQYQRSDPSKSDHISTPTRNTGSDEIVVDHPLAQSDGSVARDTSNAPNRPDDNAEYKREGSNPDMTEKAANYMDTFEIWHLTASSLRDAIQHGHLSPEAVPVEDIQDKSKSDIFTKMLAVIQICYFVLGVLFRAGQKLSISQLELGVAGYVACSVVTYCFVFSKPKSVATPIVLGSRTKDGLTSLLREIGSYPKRTYNDGTTYSDNIQEGEPVPNDYEGSYEYRSIDRADAFWASIATSVLFGAVHISGWNFAFPTPVDTWLWRVSAIVSALIGPVCIAPALVFIDCSKYIPKWILNL